MSNTTKVTHVTVSEQRCGQRVDNFIKYQLHRNIPVRLICKLIRTGQVRVNSKRVAVSYKLQLNDKVRIPPLSIEQRQERSTASLAFWQQKLQSAILYEDDQLLILNKPSRIAVHGGSNINLGVIETLRTYRTDKFLELAHRLDKETSGCLLIAKKLSYLRALHQLLRDGKIYKSYLALSQGTLQKQRLIELPLTKYRRGKEHMVRVSKLGSEAITTAIPIEKFDNSSLLQVIPHTGKTHQIRVHLAYLGLPIAGDSKYGNRQYNVLMQQLGLDRLFLHASKLKFVCPKTGKMIKVQAKYDDTLEEVLNKMR